MSAIDTALAELVASKAAPKAPRLTPGERARRVGGTEVRRIKTGYPSLDHATRGGILARKVVVVGGAPGAGKTAFLVRIAYTCLREGTPVAIIAADEDADALIIRLGQLHGLERDALERGDAAAREALAAWLDSVPLILADGDEDEAASIEAVSTELKALARDSGVLIVDSMQTARCDEPVDRMSDIRSKVNANVRALKRAAKVDGHVVFVTSEISKAAYRNKAQAENINALSAFKESGDIEYGVSVAVVLVSQSGTSEVVEAAVVKNRLGPGKPDFLLKLDHDRADVREVSIADVSIADPLAFVKADIMRLYEDRAYGYGLGRNTIVGRVGGRKTRVLQAINELLAAHQLTDGTEGVRRPLPGEAGFEGPLAPLAIAS